MVVVIAGGNDSLGPASDQGVSSNLAMSYDIITFGNGDGDFAFGANNNKITFGNGNGDFVQDSNPITDDIIAFGKGAGDIVSSGFGLSNSIITFGDGNGDGVRVGNNSHSGSADGNIINLWQWRRRLCQGISQRKQHHNHYGQRHWRYS